MEKNIHDGRIFSLLLILFLLAWTGNTARALKQDHNQPAAQSTAVELTKPENPTQPVVARVYYPDRATLDKLASRLDVWEVHSNEKYLIALLTPNDWDRLSKEGYHLEVDREKTDRLNQQAPYVPNQINGIQGYPCYRTVAETYQAMTNLTNAYPSLIEKLDVGDSWDKITTGGPGGYDLINLKITNRARTGPKPVLFVMGAIHPREYPTAETALRFAEYLVQRYGSDPDVTWLLDYNEIDIIPMSNPDGRVFAEQSIYEWYKWWRKNTNNSNGCGSSTAYGVDLNRNSSFHWNEGGSSGYPCDETYHGFAAASEPETQALQSLIRSLFPDQRGPEDTDSAPPSASGVMITLHSYGDQVLWPWGFTSSRAPNNAQLVTLGTRLAYLNHSQPLDSYDLYLTTGTTDDWAYGELGIAAYTFEIGNDFFEDCSLFDSQTYPQNLQALLYAAKASRRPYQTPSGPDSINVAASPVEITAGSPVTLTAIADSTRYTSYPGNPFPRIINAAHFTLDTPAWISGSVAVPMLASDGFFNTTVEGLTAHLYTSCMAPGRHTLFVESQDNAENWGVPGSVVITINKNRVIPVHSDEAKKFGAPGQVISYTLQVENLYPWPQTFATSIDSPWAVNAPGKLNGINACSSTTFPISITIPNTVTVEGSQAFTVTLTNPLDTDLLGQIRLTAILSPFILKVNPANLTSTALPGEKAVYHLTITNAITLSGTVSPVLIGSTWQTNLSTALLGPLAFGESATLIITTSVPVSVTAGSISLAHISLESSIPRVLPLDLILTTVAARKSGLVIKPKELFIDGSPGGVVTNTLWITNTGNAPDTFALSTTGSWNIQLPPTSRLLTPGDSQSIPLSMTLPTLFPYHSKIIVDVSVKSQSNLALTDTARFYITSQGYAIMLPVIQKTPK